MPDRKSDRRCPPPYVPHDKSSAKPAAQCHTPPAQGAHGGEIYRVARELGVAPEAILDCGSNGFSQAEDLTRALVAAEPYPFEHYPDPDSTALRQRLALAEGVTPGQLLAGNGSSELIWLVLRVLQPARVTLLGPTFSEYARACDAHGIPWRVLHADPAHALDISPAGSAPPPDDAQRELVVLCSPGNPCAIAAPDLPALVAHLARQGYGTVLVDLTYRDFLWGQPEYAGHRWQALTGACATETTVLGLHSFTKFFHCTGIRLGYLAGPEPLLARLHKARPPWMVSPYAEAMGQRFLDALPAYRERLPDLRADRAALLRAARATGLFDPDAMLEGTSFLTCRLHPGLLARGVTSGAARAQLLRQHVLVRDCDNIPGMPPGYLRMQARPERDEERLAKALRHTAQTLNG
ncbi:MAG TPA: aminotransferase class I/II-fold pyridoxal phosphate-dependent enzyme [Nitratidesulfovibrio sp.]|nr:aminotransferase class I/II-fold pyridoxal phosphate-dependent enzyme [Nitratidesulfovibrio sp.]